MDAPILEVRNLGVTFTTPDGAVNAVRNVNFDINEGECVGVVGESGSGKSQLFMAATGLLSPNGHAAGSVKYRGQEILNPLPQRQLNRLRGSKITMIFQDPLTSLTPHMTGRRADRRGVARPFRPALWRSRQAGAGSARSGAHPRSAPPHEAIPA